MKSTVVIISLCLLALLIQPHMHAASPFQPHEAERFQKLENGAVRVLKVSHNFDADSASISSVNLGTLPADSVITKSYAYIDSVLVSADSNTLGVTCESTADVIAAQDYSGYLVDNVITSGGLDIASVSTSNLKSDGCDLTMEIGVGQSGITAGRWIGIFEYFQPETTQ